MVSRNLGLVNCYLVYQTLINVLVLRCSIEKKQHFCLKMVIISNLSNYFTKSSIHFQFFVKVMTNNFDHLCTNYLRLKLTHPSALGILYIILSTDGSAKPNLSGPLTLGLLFRTAWISLVRLTKCSQAPDALSWVIGLWGSSEQVTLNIGLVPSSRTSQVYSARKPIYKMPAASLTDLNPIGKILDVEWNMLRVGSITPRFSILSVPVTWIG